ncbi:MAG: hypothetical protein B7Y03_07850 [Polaromonas sp. 24-62-144]|nr:MAG: hypothetical protein B7Y03_07850 [Polaromonas sp. 24-62-144]
MKPMDFFARLGAGLQPHCECGNPFLHLHGSFPFWGKVGMGASPAPNPARANRATDAFQPRRDKADHGRSTPASPHPGLPPAGKGGRTRLGSYDFLMK